MKVTKIGKDFVELEWKAPHKDGGAKITGYIIEKCEETSEAWMKVGSVKAFDTSFKVLDLKENVGYFFAVSAKNEAGLSKPCELDAPVKPKRPAGKQNVSMNLHVLQCFNFFAFRTVWL